MYDKIAYGVTDEMIKRAVMTPYNPIQSQELLGNAPKENPAIELNPTNNILGDGTFGSSFSINSKPVADNPFISSFNNNAKPQITLTPSASQTPITFPGQSIVLGNNPTINASAGGFQTAVPTFTSTTTPGVSRASVSNVEDYDKQYQAGVKYWTDWFYKQPKNVQDFVLSGGFNSVNNSPHYYFYGPAIEQIRKQMVENSKTNPTANPVQEGGNFSGRAYTPNAYALNSSRQPYSTFERGWLATPLSREAIDYQQHMNPNSAYNRERARQAKIRQDALNAKTKERWQEQYNTVNSQGKDFRDMPLYQEFARTQRSLFGKTWAEKGFTEDQIDDYLMRQFQHKMDNVGVKQASANILSLILPKDVLAKEKSNG